MVLRNQTNSHISKPISLKQNTKPQQLFEESGASLILTEICDILHINIDPSDSKRGTLILETLKKMEWILSAVPRMESFIAEIQRSLSEPQTPID